MARTLDSRVRIQHDAKVIAASPPPSGPTFAQAVVSVIGAMGIVLLVPLTLLAVGTPVALAVRGLLEAARWLLRMMG